MFLILLQIKFRVKKIPNSSAFMGIQKWFSIAACRKLFGDYGNPRLRILRHAGKFKGDRVHHYHFIAENLLLYIKLKLSVRKGLTENHISLNCTCQVIPYKKENVDKATCQANDVKP